MIVGQSIDEQHPMPFRESTLQNITLHYTTLLSKHGSSNLEKREKIKEQDDIS
jgi:hypothetical protein